MSSLLKSLEGEVLKEILGLIMPWVLLFAVIVISISLLLVWLIWVRPRRKLRRNKCSSRKCSR